MRKTIIAAAGIALMSMGAVQAREPYTLSFSPSDLTSESKVAALYDRIEQVARSYCPDYGRERTLREISSCRTEVTADLVAKVGHPRLSAYAGGARGEALASAVSGSSTSS